eukprot:scaffold2248_cov133-Isochrysis_galbana.AAC.14
MGHEGALVSFHSVPPEPGAAVGMRPVGWHLSGKRHAPPRRARPMSPPVHRGSARAGGQG